MVVNYYSLQRTAKGAANGNYVINSLMIQHTFLYSAANCYSFEDLDDLAACQAVANLCVLQHYDLSTTVRSRKGVHAKPCQAR